MIQTEWLLYWHAVAVFLRSAEERASLSYKYLAGHLTASKSIGWRIIKMRIELFPKLILDVFSSWSNFLQKSME